MAAHDDHLRIVVVGWRQREQHRCAVGTRTTVNGGGDVGVPGRGRWVEQLRGGLCTGVEHFAVGQQVQAWVEVRRPGCRILLAPARADGVELDRGVGSASLVQAGEGHHPPIS